MNIKQMFGITTWNKIVEYYNNALEQWKRVFTKTNPKSIVLWMYWHKWIMGKVIMVGNCIGMKKCVHSILATRETRTRGKDTRGMITRTRKKMMTLLTKRDKIDEEGYSNNDVSIYSTSVQQKEIEVEAFLAGMKKKQW